MASRSSEGANAVEHGSIFAELLCIELGVASAKVERVQFCRQRPIGDGAKGDDPPSLLTQQIQVVFVVKGESAVASHAYAHASQVVCRDGGRGSSIDRAIELQDGINPEVGFCQIRKDLRGPLALRCRMQSEVTLG